MCGLDRDEAAAEAMDARHSAFCEWYDQHAPRCATCANSTAFPGTRMGDGRTYDLAICHKYDEIMTEAYEADSTLDCWVAR